MRNPTVQSMLTNPRALDAMQQVMQGMQTLNSEAPGLFPKYVYVKSVQIKVFRALKMSRSLLILHIRIIIS